MRKWLGKLLLWLNKKRFDGGTISAKEWERMLRRFEEVCERNKVK